MLCVAQTCQENRDRNRKVDECRELKREGKETEGVEYILGVVRGRRPRRWLACFKACVVLQGTHPIWIGLVGHEKGG